MTTEAEGYAGSIDLLTQDILRTFDGLSDEAANWRPPVPETNSMYVIATHVIGSTGRWLGRTVAGREIQSDREAEFRASGPVGPLRERLQEMARDARSILTSLPASEYDATRRVTLGDQPQEWTVRQCVLHVIEHLGMHLGHLQLTRQLWEAGIGASR